MELLAAARQELVDQAIEAREANSIWYFTRTMCQIILPPSAYPESAYVGNSGSFHMVVQTLPPLHVPWGIYPRGILTWLTTEIKLRRNATSKSRVIELGTSLAEFMQQVSGSKTYSGGKTGNVRPFKRQLTSLFSSRIAFWIGEGRELDIMKDSGLTMQIGESWNLMWHPRSAEQPGLVQSTVEIGEKFWEDCVKHGVAIDIRIVRAIWPNCLAFDIYVWLTYRAYTLGNQGRVSLDLSWIALKMQFGGTYKTLKGFRYKFLEALGKVAMLYTDFAFTEREGKGMTFTFKRPSIRRVSFPESFPGFHSLPQASTHK